MLRLWWLRRRGSGSNVATAWESTWRTESCVAPGEWDDVFTTSVGLCTHTHHRWDGGLQLRLVPLLHHALILLLHQLRRQRLRLAEQRVWAARHNEKTGIKQTER